EAAVEGSRRFPMPPRSRRIAARARPASTRRLAAWSGTSGPATAAKLVEPRPRLGVEPVLERRAPVLGVRGQLEVAQEHLRGERRHANAGRTAHGRLGGD